MSRKQATISNEEEGRLRAKLEQASKVITSLVGDATATGSEGRRALEYFSSGRYDPHFLPWPREPADGIHPRDLNATNDD